MDRPIRTAHVITGLGVGGAEMMLYRLLAHGGPSVAPRVAALAGGPLAEKIRALGVPVDVFADPFAAFRLAGLLRREKVDVVQTWMYHADLIGGLAGRLAGVPVVWGLHNSTLTPEASRRSTRALVALLAALSRWWPARILSCSEAARRVHAEKGYDAARMTVVPNGFDLRLFRPDAAARERVRREWGQPEDRLLVGHAARFHPQKDHATFLAAAARVAERRPEARFVLCGEGVSAENAPLAALARAAGVLDRCLFLGLRDTATVMPALDVLVSSSCSGEAFPLVVGEAMACGVPCAVTDVGDSALMVGDMGRVAPPADPAALAAAVDGLLALPAAARRDLGAAARRRVSDNYEIGRVAAMYEALHRQAAGARTEGKA